MMKHVHGVRKKVYAFFTAPVIIFLYNVVRIFLLYPYKIFISLIFKQEYDDWSKNWFIQFYTFLSIGSTSWKKTVCACDSPFDY